MTEASAASCAACATPVRAGTVVCPRCASPVAPPLADLPVLLAGCVPAGAGARAGARVVDGLLVLLPAALGATAATFLAPAALPAVLTGAALASVLVLAGLVAAYGRTGRTPGLAVCGARAIDVVTGCVPGTAGGPARWRGDVVELDVRAGRDPVTTPTPGDAEVAFQAPAAVTSGYQAQPSPERAPAAPAPHQPAATSAVHPQQTRHHQPPSTPAPAPARTASASPSPATPPAHAAAPGEPRRTRSRHASPEAAPTSVVTTSPSAAPGAHVRLDDGRSVVVSGVTLVGRNPAPAPGDPHADLLPLPDLTRSVSKTHAVLRWDGQALRVTDRRSTNGTLVETGGERYRLAAGVETVAPVGTRIVLGDHVLTVEGVVT